MTVKISDINSTFSNTISSYTGLQMNITDVASGANSLIFHISVNGQTRIAVDKRGCFTIRANVNYQGTYPYANNPGSLPLLSVWSNYSVPMFVTPEGTSFERPIWAQSHAEGHEDISYQGNNVLIDLGNASFFTTNTSNINTFNIKWPNVQAWGSYDRIWTFSLLIQGPCDLNPNMWWDSGRYNPNWSPLYSDRGYDYLWMSGGPPIHIEAPTILTFQHGRPWNSYGNLKWLGVTSGQNFLPVLA